MVTCRQLMELDIFHNVKLKAGRRGSRSDCVLGICKTHEDHH